MRVSELLGLGFEAGIKYRFYRHLISHSTSVLDRFVVRSTLEMTHLRNLHFTAATPPVVLRRLSEQAVQ